MTKKTINSCDCQFIWIDGVFYKNYPYENCKICFGKGWYLGEEDEIKHD